MACRLTLAYYLKSGTMYMSNSTIKTLEEGLKLNQSQQKRHQNNVW